MHVVPRRHLEHAVVERADLVAAEFDGVIHGLGVPAGRHAGREQRLHFGGEVQRVAVHRVEQRLDAEPIARGEHPAVVIVPQHERELSAQLVQALRAEVLVQVQRDLAVRSRAQPVSRLLEPALRRLEIVELAVDDDPRALVLARDRLIAGRQVDDAEPRMPQRDAPISRQPLALTVRSAVIEPPGRALDEVGRERRGPGEEGDDATHKSAISPGPARDASSGRRATRRARA